MFFLQLFYLLFHLTASIPYVAGDYYYLDIISRNQKRPDKFYRCFILNNKTLVSKKNLDEFICSLSKNAVDIPVLDVSLSDGIKYYETLDDISSDSLYKNIEVIEDKMYKSRFVYEMQLADSTNVSIDIYKFNGSLWKVYGSNFLNSGSNRLFVDSSCYGKRYYYVIRGVNTIKQVHNINEVFKFSN